MHAQIQSQKPKRRQSLLRVSITAKCGRAHGVYLRRQLRRAHALLRPPLRELSVALVGDRQMSDLHERFMSIAGPTDVLTFPLEMDEEGLAVSGEVVVCVPEARRRAGEHGNSVANELLLYALHGLLHLCGYDDRTAREFEIMHRAEDDLLCRLGVGPLFGSPTKTGSLNGKGQPKASRRQKLK